MKFFTADLHFGHMNVISYTNRPYKDLEEMHAAILKTWNNTVGPNDTVYVLGDFSLNPKWVELYLPQMNGEKHLIMGNHDSCFPQKNGAKAQRTAKMRERYFTAGFKTITERSHVLIGETTKAFLVELSHFPFAPKDNINEDRRYLHLRPVDTGQILLHGHSHCWYRKRDKMIDVGFDGDLKIFSENDIIALIEDPREFIETPISEHYKNRRLKEDV